MGGPWNNLQKHHCMCRRLSSRGINPYTKNSLSILIHLIGRTGNFLNYGKSDQITCQLLLMSFINNPSIDSQR